MPPLSRLAGLFLFASALAGCSSGFVDLGGLTTGSVENSYAAEADRSGSRLPGRVYIMRGMGHIWSSGMTEMADMLNRRGVTASSHKHTEWKELADDAIRLHKKDPDRWPIIIIGHSHGGDNAIRMAEQLNEEGVPVALAIGFDPTRFSRNVPANVRRFINLYQATNVMGGGQIHPGANFRGQLINVDLRNHPDIGHMNIDKSRRLQEEVIAKVLQVAAFPMLTTEPMVSIKYVVPAKARIELWDGGVPGALEPGQTIETLAAQHGVPAWAVRQASGLDDDDVARPGQRLVVPRHMNTLPPAPLLAAAEAPAPAFGAAPTIGAASPMQPAPGSSAFAEPRRGETQFGQPRIGQPRAGAIGE